VPPILYSSSQYPDLDAFQDPELTSDWVALSITELPDPDTFVAADMTLILGEFGNQEQGMQLGGLLSLAIPKGATVVLAYSPALTSGQNALLQELLSFAPGDFGGWITASDVHPAFREYFAVWGRSSMFFERVRVEHEPLAHGSPGDTSWATALCYEKGAGALYVLPFQLTSPTRFLRTLIDSVNAHRSGGAGSIPAWLDGLRLSGEQDVLDTIDDLETEIATHRQRAVSLARFRLLVGSLHDTELEALVIEALNFVLEGSDYSAQDREDLGAEDFWLIGPNGDHALAESKGIGSHVRREHVNQVDNHRSAAGRDVDDLPGLLVVNVFRGNESMDQRLLPVSDDVIRHADRQNVLILRGIDLYKLVSRKLAGDEAATELVGALDSHGGWLEVSDDRTELHRP
jgi:hypothetical protein